MSTINAVRLVNINYNNGNIRIGDETLYLNGESTLIKLQNGGGKTVLTQMIMAPLVRRRDRDRRDRPFAGYFRDNRPSFILEEWALDNKAGFVTVGMMVRKNQNPESDDELEMICLISEYKKSCEQDAIHLPVTEREGSSISFKSFAACRSLLESYQRSPSRFDCYNMNDAKQARRYYDRLEEFGISSREWRLIRRINEEESGLSKLFVKCRTDKDLTEEWFLDAISAKIDQKGKRIEELRENLTRHIALYYEHREDIRRIDTIRMFDAEAERIALQGETCIQAYDASADALGRIAAYIRELNRLLVEARAACEAEETALCEVIEEIRRNTHRQYSAEYYQREDAIRVLAATIAEAEAAIRELTDQADQWTRQRHLLACAEQQENVDRFHTELLEAEARLALCDKEEQDIAPERDYLGYRIRRSLEDVTADLRARIQTAEEELARLAREDARVAARIKELDERIRDKSGERGRLEGALEAYRDKEARFNARWHENLARNIMEEYDPGALTGLASTLETRRAETARTYSQRSKTVENNKETIRRRSGEVVDLENRRQESRQSLYEARKDKEMFDAETEVRRTILQYLGLDEGTLYESERIERALDSKLAEIDVQIDDLARETAELATRLRNLETGRITEIAPELQQMLDNLGIRYVYGMEWLGQNGQTEDENREMVARHPFLPYALLMSEMELRKLRNAETTVYTSAPVPIVTRESLAHGADAAIAGGTEAGHLYGAGGTHFYMLFNQNLLNEESLARLVADLQCDLDDKQETLVRRRQERNDYQLRKGTIAGQKVTREGLAIVTDRIARLEQDILDAEGRIAAAREDVSEVTRQNEELRKELDGLRMRMTGLDQEAEDLRELTRDYEAYQTYLKRYRECGAQLQEAEADRVRCSGQQEAAQSRTISLHTGRTELLAEQRTQDQLLAGFLIYQEVPRPESIPDETLESLAVMQARYQAITDQMSGRRRGLQDEHRHAAENYRNAQSRLGRLARKYVLSDEDWREVRYSVAEEERAEQEISRLDKERDRVARQRAETDTRQRLEQQRQEQIVERMAKDCGTDQPLAREDVPQMDYAKAESALKARQRACEQRVSDLKGRISLLEQNVDSLAEYQGIEMEQETSWTEDMTALTSEELRAYTRNLRQQYTRCVELEQREREQLTEILDQIMDKTEFQDSYYKTPLGVVRRLVPDARRAMEHLATIRKTYHTQLDKLEADTQFVEQKRVQIAGLIETHIKQVHEELGKIGKNSTTQIRGRAVRMLRVDLPKWESDEGTYHVRVNDIVDSVTAKGLAVIKDGDPNALEQVVSERITTARLYDTVVGLGNVHIRLYKIEQQREVLISWGDVAKNSGGEGFLSAFVVFASLLDYMRRDDTDIFANRNEGKVLLMDNPYAQTNAAHLLEPLNDLARKYNIQMICLTGLDGESIYSSFDNIYTLNLVTAGRDGSQRLKAEHDKGEDHLTLEPSLLHVVDYNYEQMTLPF